MEVKEHIYAPLFPLMRNVQSQVDNHWKQVQFITGGRGMPVYQWAVGEKHIPAEYRKQLV